eukprot:403361287
MGQACTNCQSNPDDTFNASCMEAKWCGGARNMNQSESESRNQDNFSMSMSLPDLNMPNPGLVSPKNYNYYQEEQEGFIGGRDSAISKNLIRGKSGNMRVSHKLQNASRNGSSLLSKQGTHDIKINSQLSRFSNVQLSTGPDASRLNTTNGGRLSTLGIATGQDKNLVYVEAITLIDQSQYTGFMQKASNGFEVLKHGKGVQVWKDGAKYDGDWQDGKANGKGTFFHTNGDVYEGEFREDRANGQGTYYHKNGSKYTGSWKDDLKDGHGREEWEDGSYYEGHFKSGAKHGQGRYQWADGSIYDGVWVDNNIEGHGKYKWPDNRTYEGSWRENKLHGKGLYTWVDGRKYDGFYVDDKKQGFGTYIWPDGRKYEGYWHNGKQHGEGKFINSKGKAKSGIWDNGQRVKWLDSKKDKVTKGGDNHIYQTPASDSKKMTLSTDIESSRKNPVSVL